MHSQDLMCNGVVDPTPLWTFLESGRRGMPRFQMSVQRWTSLNECLLDENDRISESVDSRRKPPPPPPKKKENVSKSYNTRRHFLSYKPDVGACCNGSLASSNPLDWNLRRKPMQTNKLSNRQGTMVLFQLKCF